MVRRVAATTKATSVAWLESIELENVRCFRERQTVPFTTREGEKAQWTVLLGENGTGKSTLLQVIAMLMPRTWHPYQNGKSHQSDSSIYSGSSSILRGFAPLKQSKQFLPDFTLTLMWDDKKIQWNWCIESEDIVSSREPFPLNPPRLPPCFAYAPYRSAQAFIPEDNNPTDVEGIFQGFTRLRHPGQWFQDRTFAAINPSADKKTKKIAQSVLERVRKTLLSILPDVTDLRIETEQEGRGANRLRAKTPYGWVDIDHLGFGYQSVLALVVDIASRLVEFYPDSPNPLAEPAVILIDEVDLHLHPKWQRTLQQELSHQFPNAQFIATAHSPLVVQSSPEANILLLKREGDHVTVERAPEVIKTWRVDQILTSDLFGLPTARPPQLDDLIQERDAILGKPELSAPDEKRLEELRGKIETIPGGESRWEMEAAELIRKAANELKPAKAKAKRAPAKTKKTGRA